MREVWILFGTDNEDGSKLLNLNQMFKNISKNLDYYIAQLTLFISLIGVILFYATGRDISYFIIAGASCLTYMYYCNKSISYHLNIFYLDNKYSHYLLNIGFVITFGLSIIYSHTMYSRPIGYFIFIIICTLLVFLEIFFLKESANESVNMLILSKVLAIIINLRFSILFLYPNLLGDDTWHHASLVTRIFQDGFLPADFDYSNYPIFHLLIAVFKILTDTNIKFSFIFSVSIASAFSLIFLYLIGNLINSNKIGLLSILLIGISGYNILLGSVRLVPMTLGLTYFAIFIYILLKQYEDGRISFSLLLLFYIFLIIITHTISSVAIWLVSIGSFFGSVFALKTKKYIGSTLMLISFVSMLAYWIYTSGFIHYIGTAIKDAITLDSNIGVDEISSVVQSYSYWDIFSQTIELKIFLFLFSLGFFYTLKQYNRQNSRLILLMSISLIIMCVYLSSLVFGLVSILPWRWNLFAYVSSAVIASTGLILISNIPRKQTVKVFLYLFLISVYTIFAIAGPISNSDSNVLSTQQFIRGAYLQSEMDAADTILKYSNQTIYTDSLNGKYYGRYRKVNVIDIYPHIENNYIFVDGIIIYRKYIVNNTIQIITNNTVIYNKLQSNPINSINSLKIDKIYNNGEVYAYAHSKSLTI